jgi:hypothetical protein
MMLAPAQPLLGCAEPITKGVSGSGDGQNIPTPSSYRKSISLRVPELTDYASTISSKQHLSLHYIINHGTPLS